MARQETVRCEIQGKIQREEGHKMKIEIYIKAKDFLKKVAYNACEEH